MLPVPSEMPEGDPSAWLLHVLELGSFPPQITCCISRHRAGKSDRFLGMITQIIFKNCSHVNWLLTSPFLPVFRSISVLDYPHCTVCDLPELTAESLVSSTERVFVASIALCDRVRKYLGFLLSAFFFSNPQPVQN